MLWNYIPTPKPPWWWAWGAWTTTLGPNLTGPNSAPRHLKQAFKCLFLALQCLHGSSATVVASGKLERVATPRSLGWNPCWPPPALRRLSTVDWLSNEVKASDPPVASFWNGLQKFKRVLPLELTASTYASLVLPWSYRACLHACFNEHWPISVHIKLSVKKVLFS